LKVLHLPTLIYRHLKGNMIQVYNIIPGVHDSYSTLQFTMSNISITRGNQFGIQLTHIHYNLRKHIFTKKVIDIWNSMPNEIVPADSINILKSRLDKFWYNQNLKFDWSQHFWNWKS